MIFSRLILAAAAVALVAPLAAFTPGNVECIAPVNPGGGWDFVCRTVGKLLTDTGILSSPVQVTNMPGAVGAVAYANVASKRPDDPKPAGGHLGRRHHPDRPGQVPGRSGWSPR